MTRENKLLAFAKKFFGKSEVKNRISKATMKMIFGDMKTLYDEFRKYKGPGALVYNFGLPDNSYYMEVDDIKNDIAQAEESMDAGIADALKRVMKVVEKHEHDEHSIIVTVDENFLSCMVLDFNQIDEQLEAIIELVNQ
jgi:hypothetical protein